MATPVVAIILGASLLFFGRRLFWLFVAIAGFLIGYFLAPAIFPEMSDWLRIVAGIGIGIVFGLLAIVFTRFMVALAGFFSAGPAAVLLIRYLGAEASAGSGLYWAVYVTGGVVGFVLLWAFFDWALIFVTSLAGASAIAGGITNISTLARTWQIVLFVILAVLGIMFQARSYTTGHMARGPGRRAV